MQGGMRTSRSRRAGGAVGQRRDAVDAGEAGGERTNALPPDRHADVGHAVVGGAQQSRRPFQPAGEEVLVRGLAVGAPELAAELRWRQARLRGEVGHGEGVGVPRVGEILRPEQVPGGGNGRHRHQLRGLSGGR